MNTPYPTPYPDVNALLRVLLESVQTILDSRFVGMYLYGSLTSGDFDENSDIDVVVVTDNEISGDLFSSLQALHTKISAGDSPWATQLEVSYIPRHALRRYDSTDTLHPHIDRGSGERLHMMQHDSDWVVQRYVLREGGITVAGPALQTLIDPVSSNDLRQAMLALLWWPAQIVADPAQMNEYKRGYQSYPVLSMCRILYTLKNGTVVSKRGAAHWAKETLGKRWQPLIEGALIGRQHPLDAASSEDVSGTIAFIQYALDRSQRSA